MIESKSQRKPVLQQNWVDKFISFVSPVAGAKRYQARLALEMTNAYIGASRQRNSMADWRASNGDSNTDLLYDLPTLRERSRDLCRNNPLARGAINTKVTNVVGTGLKLQSRMDYEFLGISPEQADAWERKAEQEFALWSESQDCDTERNQNFKQLQSLVYRSVLESGDCFILLPAIKRAQNPYQLTIQVVEADRVANANLANDTPQHLGGVIKNDYGAPVAYNFLLEHPGAIFKTSYESKVIPAFNSQGRRNVLHIYHKLRPGQTRGIPDLAPVTEALKQLGRYTEGELMAAVVSGLFSVFIKSNDADFDFGGASYKDTLENRDTISLSPGKVTHLLPGEDIGMVNPGRPNQAFDPFVTAILRQVGVALELPYEVLVKHFTASYSAARAALIEAWKFFITARTWLTDSFCQPVYEAWMDEAVANGRISAPGYFEDNLIRKAYLGADWVGPTRGQIDEGKEVEAAKLRIETGLSTLEQETAQMTGGDFEANHRQRKKEMSMRTNGGLELSPEDKLKLKSGNKGPDPNA
jgi:lambda family phage portal protein